MTDTTRTEDSTAYKSVLRIHGRKYADMWLEGRVAPSPDDKHIWMALRHVDGSHRAAWFDTEDSAAEYLLYFSCDTTPAYLAKTVSVLTPRMIREWKELPTE